VDNFALFRRAGILGNAPGLRGGRDEHRVRRSSGFTQDLPHSADAVAAGGELCAAKVWIAVFGIGRNPFGFDFVPVDVELFGNEHRHGCHHTLPHLELRQFDNDVVVRADFQPDIGLERACCFGSSGLTQTRQIPTDDHRATGRAHL
jgi:hypothetical protein